MAKKGLAPQGVGVGNNFRCSKYDMKQKAASDKNTKTDFKPIPSSECGSSAKNNPVILPEMHASGNNTPRNANDKHRPHTTSMISNNFGRVETFTPPVSIGIAGLKESKFKGEAFIASMAEKSESSLFAEESQKELHQMRQELQEASRKLRRGEQERNKMRDEVHKVTVRAVNAESRERKMAQRIQSEAKEAKRLQSKLESDIARLRLELENATSSSSSSSAAAATGEGERKFLERLIVPDLDAEPSSHDQIPHLPDHPHPPRHHHSHRRALSSSQDIAAAASSSTSPSPSSTRKGTSLSKSLTSESQSSLKNRDSLKNGGREGKDYGDEEEEQRPDAHTRRWCEMRSTGVQTEESCTSSAPVWPGIFNSAPLSNSSKKSTTSRAKDQSSSLEPCWETEHEVHNHPSPDREDSQSHLPQFHSTGGVSGGGGGGRSREEEKVESSATRPHTQGTIGFGMKTHQTGLGGKMHDWQAGWMQSMMDKNKKLLCEIICNQKQLKEADKRAKQLQTELDAEKKARITSEQRLKLAENIVVGKTLKTGAESWSGGNGDRSPRSPVTPPRFLPSKWSPLALSDVSAPFSPVCSTTTTTTTTKVVHIAGEGGGKIVLDAGNMAEFRAEIARLEEEVGMLATTTEESMEEMERSVQQTQTVAAGVRAEAASARALISQHMQAQQTGGQQQQQPPSPQDHGSEGSGLTKGDGEEAGSGGGLERRESQQRRHSQAETVDELIPSKQSTPTPPPAQQSHVRRAGSVNGRKEERATLSGDQPSLRHQPGVVGGEEGASAGSGSSESESESEVLRARLQEMEWQLQRKDTALQHAERATEQARFAASQRMNRLMYLEKELSKSNSAKDSVDTSPVKKLRPTPPAERLQLPMNTNIKHDDGLKNKVEALRGALVDAHQRLTHVHGVASSNRCFVRSPIQPKNLSVSTSGGLSLPEFT